MPHITEARIVNGFTSHIFPLPLSLSLSSRDDICSIDIWPCRPSPHTTIAMKQMCSLFQKLATKSAQDHHSNAQIL